MKPWSRLAGGPYPGSVAGRDASPLQVPPPQFTGTHLYTWMERGTVRVKCLAQEHNTMSPARARTRGPFLESPDNLTGPKSYIEIKVLRKVGHVLTSNKVQFVSLADNFTV